MDMKRDEEERQEPIMGCCICFENLAEAPPETQVRGLPDKVSIAPCGHIFHFGCITKCLQGKSSILHNTCPSCLNEFEAKDLMDVHFLETTCKDSRYLIMKERLELSKQSYFIHLIQVEANSKLAREKLKEKEDEILQVKQQLKDVKVDLGESRGNLRLKDQEINQLNEQLTRVRAELKRKAEELQDFEKQISEVLEKRRRRKDDHSDNKFMKVPAAKSGAPQFYSLPPIAVASFISTGPNRKVLKKEKLEQREDKINRLKPQLTSVKKDLGDAREKLKVRKNRIKHLKLLLNLKDVDFVSTGTRLGQLRRSEILNSRPLPCSCASLYRK